MMKLLVCGSGASEGIPALFCNCDVCNYAREHGGPELRSRTAYQIGDTMRIDFGPDIIHHQLKYNLRLDKLRHLFMTHDHRDHFTPVALSYRAPGYAHFDTVMNFYALPHIIDMVTAAFARHNTNIIACKINPIPLKYFQEVYLDDLDLKVTCLPATHETYTKTSIYAIKGKDSQFFVATDSGYFFQETWEKLKDFKFNTVILDGTSGVLNGRSSHMGRACVLEVVERMHNIGCVDNNTLILTNHFSHNGKMTHADMLNFYGPHRIHPAYDGLEIQL